jgi:hypothetical protein
MTASTVEVAIDFGLDVARSLTPLLTWAHTPVTPPTCRTSPGGAP